VISPSQKPLRDNTQHLQETDFFASGGIQTCNPSKRASADPRLRLRGHWDRLVFVRHTNHRLTSRGIVSNVRYRFPNIWIVIKAVVKYLLDACFIATAVGTSDLSMRLLVYFKWSYFLMQMTGDKAVARGRDEWSMQMGQNTYNYNYIYLLQVLNGKTSWKTQT
jgi:hypothetical protein